MTKTCTKCKNPIPDDVELDPIAANYPCCNDCWEKWKEYRVMVVNEMRLDMSMPEHRKALKKHEDCPSPLCDRHWRWLYVSSRSCS